LVERVESGLTQMTDWLDKVGKGLNTEEASKLASRMGTNLNDKDMFTFEDGNWYVNDISAVVANI
jgi:hypothetical protein